MMQKLLIFKKVKNWNINYIFPCLKINFNCNFPSINEIIDALPFYILDFRITTENIR